jgi:hypothetical protein
MWNFWWFNGLIFILAWAGGLYAQPLVDWEPFVEEEAGFAVKSPAPLLHRVDTAYTPLGPLAYHTFFYRVPEALKNKRSNEVYMVSLCDYPPGSLDREEPDWLRVFFEETIAAAAQSVGGQVIYKTETKVEGYPAYLWRIRGPGGRFTIKTKAFLAGRRYYAIQVVGTSGRSVNAASETFMDSFRLLP